MSDSKARRTPTVVANSKYARGPKPQDDRRRRLESLTQDADAIARAKQDFAEISRQQLGRAAAPVQLDDIEVRQRKPLYAVAAPEPSPEVLDDTVEDVPARPPKRVAPKDQQQASPVRSASAKGKIRSEPLEDQPGARAVASRGMFAHVEHRPAVPAAPPRLRNPDQGWGTRENLLAARYDEPWPIDQQLRSSRGLLVCALIIAVSLGVIWLLQAPQRTFIGRSGLPFGLSQDTGAEQAAQQVAINPGEHSVLGAPSISAAAIDTILAQYGSPAAGTGQIWISLGQRYGIDPAYAVAFFIHESSAGTNPGWAGIKSDGSTTHNVGNIICAGYATCYGRFRDYANWDEGIGDWYKLISHEYVNGRGAASVEQIIPIYAPSFENDVDRYIQTVISLVEGWRQRGVSQ